MKWVLTAKREVCQKFSSMFIYFSLPSHWTRTTEDIVPTEHDFIRILCSSLLTSQSCFLEKSVIFLPTSSVSHASDTESVDKHIRVFCAHVKWGASKKRNKEKKRWLRGDWNTCPHTSCRDDSTSPQTHTASWVPGSPRGRSFQLSHVEMKSVTRSQSLHLFSPNRGGSQPSECRE